MPTDARRVPGPPPSAPGGRALGPLPVAPPSAPPSAPDPVAIPPETPTQPRRVPAVSETTLAALRAQRSPAKAVAPEESELVFDLEETVEAPPDRTVRAPIPSPGMNLETTEAPPEDRTGQFDMAQFQVAPAPSPLAAPRTHRGKDSGLKPAVAPRPEAPRKKEAVQISVKELVRTTPRPPPPAGATSVLVDASAFPSPATELPRRTTTRELTAHLPRGVLKPAPVRRSKKVDDLQFLGPPPEFVKDSPLVGIDLGTTNSVCAVLAGGRPVVLKTTGGANVVPSLVAINKAQKLTVGYAAHAEFMHNPAQCIYGSKRLVGRDFDSPAVDAVRERFAYEIVKGKDDKAAVTLGGKLVSLEEIQAIILTECRLMAEKFLAKRVSRAVVTCPAYFTEAQRQSIRVAGALAGLRVERILIEPTAAALAYGLNQDLSRKVLVYDVGGGTFDATLLRIEKNVFEVLATGGDVFLGGLDFDHQLIDALVKRFEAEHNVLFNADPGALARIADQAEKAKIALSEKESVEVRLPMLQLGDRGRAMGLSFTLTRAELEEFSTPLVERTIEVVQGLLRDAKLKAADVDEVVLVGGMSRMPMVRERLRQLFKKQPHASINAEEAIAVGAALFTGVVDQVSNVVLIDVAPMTIGLGLPGGGYKRLINRNTPLPASASIGVATTEDNSEVIELSVFQGEDADVAVNDYVGTIRIDGLPRAPKGVVKVAINLKLDANCVLHVDARELHTRRRFESTLATRYTTAEVQKQLGIKPQAARAALTKRTEEIKKRSGRGIFGFLRSAFSRKGR